MRETLLHLIDKADADIRAYFGNSNTKLSARCEAARRWLNSAPVATDNAVCPECGHDFDPSDEDNIYHAGPIACPECDFEFEIDWTISVISPPRTKGANDGK